MPVTIRSRNIAQGPSPPRTRRTQQIGEDLHGAPLGPRARREG